MKDRIYQSFLAAKRNRQKLFVVLIDPDKVTPESLIFTIDLGVKAEIGRAHV